MFHQILRYGVVGSSGFFVNIGVFSLCKFILNFDANGSSILAFMVSVIWNYSLNRRWTFNVRGSKRIHFISGLKKYFFANLIGLGLTLVILNLALHYLSQGYSLLAQICGVLSGMVSNFLFSKFLVFKKLSA